MLSNDLSCLQTFLQQSMLFMTRCHSLFHTVVRIRRLNASLLEPIKDARFHYFLFVIAKRVIITDARTALRERLSDDNSDVSEALCADDTFMVDEQGELAQIYIHIIASQGH